MGKAEEGLKRLKWDNVISGQLPHVTYAGGSDCWLWLHGTHQHLVVPMALPPFGCLGDIQWHRLHA